MILSARFLIGFSSVNSWTQEQLFQELTAAQAIDVYLQLVDTSLDKDGLPTPGRRYCPPAGSTLSIQVTDLDSSKVVTRLASQPSPLDSSIWKLQLLSTDALATGSKSLILTLNEGGGVVKRGLVHQGLRLHPFDTSC